MSDALLIDASVFITLSEIGRAQLLETLDGEPVVPFPVASEISDDPGAKWLSAGEQSGWIRILDQIPMAEATEAAVHLGNDEPSVDEELDGDTALLAVALSESDAIVITDDKPLRKACKALGVPISGSIGVVIASVERGALEPDEAKDALVAMDEAGARLSASLLRRAERLIDDAAGGRKE